MERTLLKPVLALTLLSLAPLLAPSAAANPCAAPCGEVRIVTDCFSAVVSGEGVSTLGNTVWSFTAYEIDGYVQTTVPRGPTTGSTATFAVPFTRQDTWNPWYLGGTLYANGEVVAQFSTWCPGIH